jgi:nucleoside phosphorylase
MLLVSAALEEELKVGIELCAANKKIPGLGISVWQGDCNNRTIRFLKTGVGPERSAASLETALAAMRPSRILVVGYAGALDPSLKLGDLVAVENALAFSLDQSPRAWERVRLDGSFMLTDADELVQAGRSLSLAIFAGDAMTSRHVLGDPAHKQILYARFRALIADMETAALARVAAQRGVPLSCIRVVSDEASDTFLSPFSFDPASSLPDRAKKLASMGMVRTYREWKNNTSAAKENLRRFLAGYF